MIKFHLYFLVHYIDRNGRPGQSASHEDTAYINNVQLMKIIKIQIILSQRK